MFNQSTHGPTFGGGHDLTINGSLSGGQANIGFSFGDTTQFGSGIYRNEFTGSFQSWSVNAIEVFTVTAIPEVSPVLGISVLGAVGMLIRFLKRQW